MVNNLDDGGELAEARTVVDQDNAANLNETLVSLFKRRLVFHGKEKKRGVGGGGKMGENGMGGFWGRNGWEGGRREGEREGFKV